MSETKSNSGSGGTPSWTSWGGVMSAFHTMYRLAPADGSHDISMVVASTARGENTSRKAWSSEIGRGFKFFFWGGANQQRRTSS